MGENTAATTLEQGIALFETVGMPTHNLAVRTRREYLNDLHAFLSFLAERDILRLDQIGLRDLEAYYAKMDRRGLAWPNSTPQRSLHSCG